MNTFHIRPTDPLAAWAANELRALDPELLVAVRGQVFDGEDTVYTVSPCPDQRDTPRYEWTYVRVGDWLDEFDNQIRELRLAAIKTEAAIRHTTRNPT